MIVARLTRRRGLRSTAKPSGPFARFLPLLKFLPMLKLLPVSKFLPVLKTLNR
jgi:hypothetical protein